MKRQIILPFSTSLTSGEVDGVIGGAERPVCGMCVSGAPLDVHPGRSNLRKSYQKLPPNIFEVHLSEVQSTILLLELLSIGGTGFSAVQSLVDWATGALAMHRTVLQERTRD